MQEYYDIRAAMRAAAADLLGRKDFYTIASQEEINTAKLHGTSLSVDDLVSKTYLKDLSPATKEVVEEIEAEYEARKNEVVDRIRARNNMGSDVDISHVDIVRLAMRDVVGVNSKGVSTSLKRID